MKSILLILLTTISFLPNSFAQSSPGGVSVNDLTLWLDANDEVELAGSAATNGGSVDSWVNQKNNPGCIDLNQTSAPLMPIFRTNALNFNPIVEFDGVNDQLDRNVLGSEIFDASNNTIFFVHKFYSGAVYFKWEQSSGGNRVGFENSTGSPRFDFPTDAAGNQTTGTFPLDPIGQIVTAHTSGSTAILRNMGGQNIANPITGTLNTSFTSDISIGENVDFPLASQIDFAEIIIYNEALSAVEMNKVESYLAVKYGMTLGINGTSLNYNSSGGSVIWDITANTGFNFDIAGISRDDLSDQDQRKSKSINQSAGIDSDILTVANSTNLAVPAGFGTDMSHLIWGHNNAATVMNNTAPFTTTNSSLINVVLDRHWKSQETGPVGVTTLHFELANVTGFTNWSDIKLLVDDDGNFTAGATSFTPSFIDSTGAFTIEFEHDFSATEGFYFTLAASSILLIDNPLPVIACDSFILVPITGINLINPQYYSATDGPNGVGVVIPVGTVINSSSIIYLYDETGGTPNQFDEDTLNITINPSPVVTAPTDISYCAGAIVPPSAYSSVPAGATYEWQHTNTAVGLLSPINTIITGNTPPFTATNTTLFPDTSTIFVIPELNSCYGDTVDYFIIVNPTPAAPTARDTLICTNNSTVLTATAPGGSYDWYDAAIGGNLLVAASSTYTTPVLTATTSYWVQSTILNCSGPRTQVDVTIGQGLVVGASATNVDICAGETTTLDASPNNAFTYTWTEPGGSIIPSVFNPTVTPADTTKYKVEVTDIFGCIGIDSVTINVKPLPVVTPIPNGTYCSGDVVPAQTYSSTPAATSFFWTNSDPSIGLAASDWNLPLNNFTTPSFTADNISSQPHTATITVKPFLNGCTGNVVTHTITVNPIPTMIIPASNIYCIGEVVPATQFFGTPIGSTYDWTNTNTSTGMSLNGTSVQSIPSFTATNTTFIPNVSNVFVTPFANGCVGNTINFTATVSSTIVIDKYKVTHPTCFESTDGEIIIIPSGGTPEYTYNWTSGDMDSIASNLPAGQVTVTVTDVNGCFQDSIFLMIEPDSIDYITFTASPRAGCSPLDVQFNSTINPAQHLLEHYVWDFGNNLVPQDTFIANSTYANPGMYDVSLTVTDFDGCSNTLTIADFIEVYEDPEAHFTSSPANPDMLNPTVDFTDVSFPNVVGWEWYFDTLGNSNYQNPSFIFPEDSGSYHITLVVEDSNTCKDTLTHVITFRSKMALFLPNSFTPNGDGVNDTFIPKGYGVALENYSFQVFNRWGELVFQSNSPLNGWDGSLKGEILPNGIYVWRMDYEDLNGKEYKQNGQINIFR